MNSNFSCACCLCCFEHSSSWVHVQDFPRADIDISAVRADRQQVAGAGSILAVRLCYPQHLTW